MASTSKPISLNTVDGIPITIPSDRIYRVITKGSGSIVYYSDNDNPHKNIKVSEVASSIANTSKTLIGVTTNLGIQYINPEFILSMFASQIGNLKSKINFDLGGGSEITLHVTETLSQLNTAIDEVVPDSDSEIAAEIGAGGDLFTSDIVVSLSGGKTFGKFSNGQTIPSTGKKASEVISMAAIEDIAPTYTVATHTLTKTTSSPQEVGTVYSNTVQATFTQNDAGPLTAIRIEKNGSDLVPNGASSPFSKVDSGSFILGNITYIGYANYGAGVIKNYMPSGTPDPRTPLVRNVNAPQAAENNFASNSLVLTGMYKIFHGPSASPPVNSANVRALPSSQFTNGGTFNLNTGTVENDFTIAMPATNSLVSVIDLDALNANITSSYVLTIFNVNDAGGNPVSYKVYTFTAGVPYGSNHRHQVTYS